MSPVVRLLIDNSVRFWRRLCDAILLRFFSHLVKSNIGCSYQRFPILECGTGWNRGVINKIPINTKLKLFFFFNVPCTSEYLLQSFPVFHTLQTGIYIMQECWNHSTSHHLWIFQSQLISYIPVGIFQSELLSSTSAKIRWTWGWEPRPHWRENFDSVSSSGCWENHNCHQFLKMSKITERQLSGLDTRPDIQ